MEETIFALASGSVPAALAVIRISGAASGALLDALSARARPPPRRAVLRRLRDGAGEVLDHAIVLWLPGPASYTGEDSAEVQCHGGAAVVEGLARRLVELGARPAEPGEFTRRAFLNGRLDLLQAEAVADLIAAETTAQRHLALRQMAGALGALYHGWSGRLLRLLAQQEALIDFPDEDLPPAVEQAMAAEIARLTAEIAAHLADGRRGERVREGLVFAIGGPPNAGKSSLMNALAEREVAIVAPQPGTTRDVLEARVVFAGVPVTLVDTAGLRESADPVEREGIRRARARAAEADLLLYLADATTEPEWPVERPAGATLRIANKIDLAPLPAGAALAVSVRSGAGMQALREKLAALAREMTDLAGPPPLTRERHRAALRSALERLHAATLAPAAELRAEDLRAAMLHLGSITGRLGVEDVLDSVFRQFCIGK